MPIHPRFCRSSVFCTSPFLFEASLCLHLQPGCLYLLSAWYTRKELVKRTALLYSGSLISGAFSGLIAAGITNGLSGARGISAWRWLFIIEGAITVGIPWHLEVEHF